MHSEEHIATEAVVVSVVFMNGGAFGKAEAEVEAKEAS